MSMFHEALVLIKQSKGERPSSLQVRLFTFFALFILVLASLFILLLLLFGVFSVGEKENQAWMENELSHLYGEISTDFGKLSYQGTALAEQINEDTDIWLKERGLAADELQDHPELLEELLSSHAQTLVFTLKTYKCTGTFMILDATVNPNLPNAEHSRAGIFLKRTEPNAVDVVSSKTHYLRGPAGIARDNGIELLGQWQMEFDVSDAAYYHNTIQTAVENQSLPLSRLYYWSERVRMKGNSETGMLLCMPLISSDGTVYGICGMEVSAMLFKRQYSPDNGRYPRIFATLAPLNNELLNANAGLVAGNSYLTNAAAGRFHYVSEADSSVTALMDENETAYMGILAPVKLYPSDSPYAARDWTLAVMMPGEDWNTAIRGNNTALCIGIILLLLVSLCLALFISKRYIRPVVEALDVVKSGGSRDIRTNIQEIDDLLEYLAAQDASREEAMQAHLAAGAEGDQAVGGPNLSAYEEFVRNIATLSSAERAVFNLYMQGHTAGEIAQMLWLSINTIKTHNKRIYTKLNVTSRKELMVYVQMMASEQEKDVPPEEP